MSIPSFYIAHTRQTKSALGPIPGWYESVKTDPIPDGMKVFEIRPVWTGTCENEHTNLQHWYKPVNCQVC